MEKLGVAEDQLWERVLAALSADGRLARFYKIPRHELRALAKLHEKNINVDLTKLFHFACSNEMEASHAWATAIGESRCFAMLLTLGRSMKCWIETGTAPQEADAKNKKRRWTVANA